VTLRQNANRGRDAGAGKVGSTVFTLKDVEKSFQGDVLFDNVHLGAFDGAKIGIVGVNGAGKSCLLKIVAGVDEGTRNALSWIWR
jgi:ATPase subunit of ABC transporter with duplicated ATPase domains